MGSAKSFLARRTVYAIIAFFVVQVIIFLIPRLAGVNPVEIMAASQQFPPSVAERLTVQFGLNKPLYLQFLLYLKNVVLSFPPNMGYSYEYYPATVWSLISSALPWTVFLVGSSVLLASVVGTGLGLAAGWKRGGLLDRGITYVALTIQSLPYFWIAIVLQVLLAVVLRLLPVAGAYSATDTSGRWSPIFIGDVLYHATLPILTLVVSTAPVYAIIMRNTVSEIMGEDFMLVAQAKGLKSSRIMFDYAMRNSLLPIISLVAINLGYVVGGALLVELVFSYPGVGTLLYNAILGHDYPVIQGVIYILSLAVIGANYLADVLYLLADPRVRYT